MHYTGSCYCRAIKYSFDVSPEEARTSLCHCHNCKVPSSPQILYTSPKKTHQRKQKFFGTNYGLTTKIPVSAFKITAGEPTVHEADNGSGSLLHREFCGVCGGPILEYGVCFCDDFWTEAGEEAGGKGAVRCGMC
jgi:hypothetical protein